MKYDDKTRLCLSLPTPLYDRLHRDSLEYGIPKSGIISMLLVEYYKENVNFGVASFQRDVNYGSVCQGTRRSPQDVAETP